MATLELQGLTKRFGEFTAVDSMNLKAAEGEMIALLGGSGCGKTTTLRMIAGFTEPTAGQILVDGENVSTIPPTAAISAFSSRITRCSPHDGF